MAKIFHLNQLLFFCKARYEDVHLYFNILKSAQLADMLLGVTLTKSTLNKTGT